MKYACVRTKFSDNPDFTIVNGASGVFDNIDDAKALMAEMVSMYPPGNRHGVVYEIFMFMKRD